MTNMLYTLAYPKLSDADLKRIEAIREHHDLPYKDVVAPHFTLVFACDDVPLESYVAHVQEVGRHMPPIAFHCRYAMLSADPLSDDAFVFLVPDEGNSAISRLHDRLYTGPLADKPRLDLDFVPHITVATKETLSTAKMLRDQVNEGGVSVAGTIDSLTVAELRDNRIEDFAIIPLAGS
ncbi:MAG: 2'-5' RNA ligase family protein [Pseudomonadota bacterium]